MNLQTERIHRLMTRNSIPRLLLRLCLPSFFGALLPPLVSLYETFLATQIGTESCGTLGIVFPIHAAIQTIGFVFGTGSGSLVANALGKKDDKTAHILAFSAIFCSVLLSALFAVFGLLFQTPLLKLLGANHTTLPNARGYLICLLLSAPILCTCYVLCNLLRAEGKTGYALFGFGIGNLFVVLFGSFLVFVQKIGILGIGLSFPIGYGIALFILLIPYLQGKTLVSLSPVFSKTMLDGAKRDVINGLPSFFRQGATVLAVILLNHAAKKYGAFALAGITISSRVFLLLYAIPLGIGQGMVPAIGYNHGSGNIDRAKRIYRICVALATLLLICFALPIAVFATYTVQWFQKDPAALPYSVPLLRSLCLVLPLHGLIAVTNLLLQALKKPVSASLLAAARQGIFFLPLIFTLPDWLGFTGIWLTQPLADVCTFCLALAFAYRFIKKRPG